MGLYNRALLSDGEEKVELMDKHVSTVCYCSVCASCQQAAMSRIDKGNVIAELH